MFKTIKKITSCLLVLCMLISVVPMGVFAAEEPTNIEKIIADLQNPESELSKNLVAKAEAVIAFVEEKTGEDLPDLEVMIAAAKDYEKTLADLKTVIDELQNPESELSKEVLAAVDELKAAIADLQNPESELSEDVLAAVNEIIAFIEAETDAELPDGEDVIDAIRNYEDTLAELEVYVQNIIDEAVAEFEANVEAATSADYATCGENNYVPVADTYTFSENVMEDLKKATIVTYQIDAKNILLPAFDRDPFAPDAWAELLDADSAQVQEVRDAIFAALKGEYAEDVETAKAEVAKIKAEILDKLNVELAEVKAGAAKVDKVVEAVLDTVKAGISDSINETILNMMTPIAEELVFNVVAYLVNNIKAVETIKAANPDALIAVVGIHNPVKGLKFDIDGQIIDLGEYVDYFIEATNVYNTAYAMATENVIFVEADETEIVGYGDEASVVNETTITSLILSLKETLETGAVVTENGQNYIASQLKAAINLVDHIDANGDEICDKCGENLAQEEEKDPVKPSRPSYGGNGGGGGLAAGGDKSNTGADDLGQKDEDKTEGTIVPSAPSFFVDVPASAWYYDVVKSAYDKGLMNGVSATTFAPNGSLTRGMFVTILYRLAGSPEVTAAASFVDVPANQYYADAVAWASANGIVNGVSADKFAPNNNITREQMAAIIHRYAVANNIEAANSNEVSYSDSAKISAFAKEAVEWASRAGVLSGNSDGTFAPLRTATRAEAAAIFVRLLGLVK